MLNPTYNDDFSVLNYEEFAAMEARNPTGIGERVVTNVPGTCGHNYATWEVKSVTLDAGRVYVSANRVA